MNGSSASQSPRRPSGLNTFITLVLIVLALLFLDVWLWSLCSKALTARSDVLPMLGMLGYAVVFLVWIPIIRSMYRWVVRRHQL